MSRRPVIILDMDETLLHTHDDSWGWRGRLTVTPRPGLKTFMNKVNAMGEVWVLSAGSPEYVPEALDVVGLHPYIEGWMSSQQRNPIKNQIIKGRPWVLVDDRPASSPLTRIKLRQCGGEGNHGKHLIVVDEFTGNPGDQVLRGLPDLIGLALQMQGGAR
jgi:hypothetical protein